MATAEDGSTVVFVRAPLAVGGSPDGLLRRERNSTTGQWGHWIDTGGQTSKNPAVVPVGVPMSLQAPQPDASCAWNQT